VWRTRAFGDFWSYCLLAEGAVDIAAEPEVSLWDLAALAVLVTEAGGRFSGLDGVDGPAQGSAVATNGLLHEDVLKALGASKLDILWNVGLPRTMPFFFASLKVAVSYAFVGAVLSETVASNRGIGNVMMTASSNFNVHLVFAGLFVLAGLGVALYAIFSVVEGRVTGWATRKNDVIAT
jgi:ABC-type Fe3+-siderophore transport system permease subunit